MQLFKRSKKRQVSNFQEVQKEVERLEEHIARLSQETEELRALLVKTVQNVGVVRFNPFREIGGNQSFSVSLLDGNKNGVVITSHYGRDSNRVYAKPIQEGKSQYTLSEEEKQLIQGTEEE